MGKQQPRPQDTDPAGNRRGNSACPSCAGSVTETNFTMKNGDTAQLRHCSRCEWKSWSHNGEEHPLADVLSAVQREGLPHGRR